MSSKMRKGLMNVKSTLRRKEPQAPRSLARKILELLGITRAYVQSLGTQEEDEVRVNLPLAYNDRKPIETALLEAEHQKAKAITQIRRQQFI